jgi:arylsulfatase A-like enzyme
MGLFAGATAASAVALGALAPVGGQNDAHAGSGQRPNVVVVMTDDQDARSVRVMRGVQQQLAGHGATFTNSFATFPLCCPSRATFLTGQYAHNHDVRDNEPPAGGYEAFDDSRTLPISLRRAGYRTALFGKYLNGYKGSRVPPGWSEWHVLTRYPHRMYGYTLNENGRLRSYGSRPQDYQTDVLARKAAGFIDRASRRSRPFFLAMTPTAPHHESGRKPGSRNPRPAPRHSDRFRRASLPRPPSFNEADVSDKPAFIRDRPLIQGDALDRLAGKYRGRLGSLLAVDDAVRRLVSELRDAGELANTVFFFTSDNGYFLGEHRLVEKTHLYEEGARVPLIMRGPGVPEGVKRPQIAGNIDLAPTILDFTGAAPLRTMDGRSLLPLARRPGVAADRDILLENQSSEAVRTQRYMYAEHPGGETELYDLRTDPYQLRSRHGDPALATVRARLAQRLAELRNCAGANCR